MLAVLILMMEMLALANLLAEEAEQGTARALLVTPVTAVDLFVAKGITGTGLAFIQAVFFIAIAGGLGHQAALVLIALVLGAVFVTGIAFIVASVSRDFMSVLGWGMLAFIISTVPAFGVLFPGTVTGWVKVIPTYYLVNTVHRAANFNAGWADLWANLAILAALQYRRVVLVDGDLGLANLHVLLGVESDGNLSSLLDPGWSARGNPAARASRMTSLAAWSASWAWRAAIAGSVAAKAAAWASSRRFWATAMASAGSAGWAPGAGCWNRAAAVRASAAFRRASGMGLSGTRDLLLGAYQKEGD